MTANRVVSTALPQAVVDRLDSLAAGLGVARSPALRLVVEAGLAALDGGGPLPKVEKLEGRRSQEIEMLENLLATVVKNDERYARALLKILDEVKGVRQAMEGK